MRIEAKQHAKDEIKQLRYSGQEYFWINDMHPAMVMHPIKPEMKRRDLSDFKDAAGKLLYNDFVALVKNEGKGFVPDGWPEPGNPAAVAKISYVKGFASWGRVIGSGVDVGAHREPDQRAGANRGRQQPEISGA